MGAFLLPISSQGSTSARLTWGLSIDENVVNYRVYYGTASRSYDHELSIGNTNEASILGLREGFTYYFAVTASDIWGNESDFSNEASYSVPPPDSMVLEAVAGPEPRSVELTWNASATNGVYAYYVYVGTESGMYSGAYASYETDAILYGLSGGLTNFFVVSAIDTNGVEVEFSNETSFVLPMPDPIVPQAFAGPVPQSVELIWNADASGDYYAYNVYYGTRSGVYDNVATFYSLNDAVVYGLTGGTTNYFAVSGIDSYGYESELSVETSWFVPAPEPVTLQTETLLDGDGQPYYLIIKAAGAVAGEWELDYSTDLRNWNYYTSGFGYGYGDDVYAYVWLDPKEPKMFFRLQQP